MNGAAPTGPRASQISTQNSGSSCPETQRRPPHSKNEPPGMPQRPDHLLPTHALCNLRHDAWGLRQKQFEAVVPEYEKHWGGRTAERSP